MQRVGRESTWGTLCGLADVTDSPASTGDLAILVLQRNALEFLEHAPGARAGSDPRHVHQMRVATRRLRAALRLFADILPPDAASLNDELKWFAGQLGPVRDLDVQIQRTHDIAAELGVAQELVPYDAWLNGQCQHARAQLAQAFESRRFGSLVQRLQRLDEWAPDHTAPIGEDAPRRLRQAYRRLRKRGDAVDSGAPSADLHAVRIRGKRLRYAAEFFQISYGEPATQLVARVVALQDLLGNLQDGVVSRHNVHDAVASFAGTWPPQTSLALGQLVQYDAQRELEIRAAFPATYRRVRKASWQRLRRALRRRALVHPKPKKSSPADQPSSAR